MTLAAIAVERLTPAHRDDFLQFFDHERGPAFADHPEWAKCSCHYYHLPKAIAWETLDATANRVAMKARLDASEMEGFLAYAAGEVVGWLNAQPYHKLSHACERMEIVPPPLDVEPHDAAAIVCFVVAPPWRGRGVARSLLDGALDSFARRGILIVDAFPSKPTPAAGASDHYHGPLSLFLAAGFSILREDEEMTVLRKRLP